MTLTRNGAPVRRVTLADMYAEPCSWLEPRGFGVLPSLRTHDLLARVDADVDRDRLVSQGALDLVGPRLARGRCFRRREPPAWAGRPQYHCLRPPGPHRRCHLGGTHAGHR